MTEFRLARHTGRNVTVVEVWEGDNMIAVIYPGEGRVKIVSKHFQGRHDMVVIDPPSLVPAVTVKIK